MSLSLCSPDKLACSENIQKQYEECLPNCSGVKITYHKEGDILKKVNSSNNLHDLVLNSPNTEH